MSNDSDNHLQAWNPFLTTQRDRERTNELAAKNTVIAGILTFIFFPAGLIYLNRGINSLKIFGYLVVLTILATIVNVKKQETLGLLSATAMTAEQVLTIKKAKQRQQESSEISTDITVGIKVDDQAIGQLKELKQRYEAKEITEEEFKTEKQKILDSL